MRYRGGGIGHRDAAQRAQSPPSTPLAPTREGEYLASGALSQKTGGNVPEAPTLDRLNQALEGDSTFEDGEDEVEMEDDDDTESDREDKFDENGEEEEGEDGSEWDNDFD
jgi:hypothetical protein